MTYKAASNVVVVSDGTITCTAPPGIGYGHSITVQVDELSNTTANLFSYLAPAFTTASNPDVLGGEVTITGANFGPSGTTANVVIGDRSIL